MFGCVLSMFAICSLGFMPVHVSHTHIDITKPYKHKTTTFQSQQAAGFFVDAASSSDCLFSLISWNSVLVNSGDIGHRP